MCFCAPRPPPPYLAFSSVPQTRRTRVLQRHRPVCACWWPGRAKQTLKSVCIVHFFARARRACCGSLRRADAKWLEFQKKGFCIFRSKILAFIITTKMSLKFETEQIKIHEVKRRHFSACGWGGEKPLKDVFTSTPFELQLRAFNLAAAAAAQNNPLHLLKRPPTLNKPLPFFAVLHI